MIYLASPFTHPSPLVQYSRFVAACRKVAELLERGVMVISPIAHSYPIHVFGGIEGKWDNWKRLDTTMLEMCSSMAVLKLPGWEDSVGIKAEVEIAKKLGMEVEYIDP